MQRHDAHRRDNSLRTLSRANRWLIAGSVALTGLLSEVAAQAFPGKASASARRAPAAKARSMRGAHSSSRHRSPSKSLTPPAEPPEAREASAEASSERSEPPAPEPSAEATHEAAPEAQQPSSSAETGPATAQPSREPDVGAAAAPEEGSAPVVSGGS